MPLASPVIVIGLLAPVAVIPPELEVTVYVVIAASPLLAGAVNVTVASPLTPVAVAVTMVGASGAPAGVTDVEAAILIPTALVAVTVNVYAIPLVSPVTVIGLEAPLTGTCPALGVGVICVTVYPVISEPPSLAGAPNKIVAIAFPALECT